MKIDADWIKDDAAQSVMAALADAGHQAFFVGGCVRNALLDVPVQDLDIATDATPDVVLALGKKQGFKSLPTGIDHGTVTWVVNNKPFEITSFRRDVATDGRRAVVEFATSIAEDAQRRDFTMNALYADADGEIHDPLNGLPDLLNRRVRFIGDPADRIKEDYLRILRFFRFFAYYADQDEGPDPDGLAACAELADGMAGLSKERVTTEIQKILSAPDPIRTLSSMEQSGVLRPILPTASTALLGPYLDIEHHADWVGRLFVLSSQDAASSLRLDRKTAAKLRKLDAAISGNTPIHEIAYRNGADDAFIVAAFLAASGGGQIDWDAITPKIEKAASSKLPISATDFPHLEGPELGKALKQAETDWIASEFSMTKSELLDGAK